MTHKLHQYPAGLLLPLATAALFGCDPPMSPRMELEPVSVNHALTQMASCDAYVAYAKKTAKQRMRALITHSCQDMWDDVNYRSSQKGVPIAGNAEEDTDMSAGDDIGNGDGSEGDFSQTNTQEAGVDEADLVKTDGDYLYVISGQDLVIVAIDETGTLTESGRITLDGRPEELFLYGNTAVVFSALGKNDIPEAMVLPGPPSAEALNLGDTNDMKMPDIDDYYGDYGGGSYTGIDVVDVTEKTAPALIRAAQYAGSYVSSRRIGGAVRAVIGTPMSALDVPTWAYVDYWDQDEHDAKKAISEACDALIDANTAYIDGLTLDDLLPQKYDSADDTVAPVAACEDIYGPKTPAGTGLLTVVSVDLENPTEKQQDVSIVGEQGQVYASTSALYLTTASDYVLTAWESGLWDDETTGIHKFDISTDPKTATYLGSGSATGRMLNQFSLGEYKENLRVATTTGSAWSGWSEDGPDNTLDNHIQIFEERGGALKVVGELSGIGTGEEVYAARFLGDRGFVVTYLQTDPLFTFDLSDPTDPKVVGEWLGPGYSTYLHPFGDDLIIAMGKDESWRTVVSLYNVGNFAEPTLVERQPLEMQNYETAAVYEHKAFTFNPETGALLLPYHDWDNDTGVLLYNVTETGIALDGSLDIDSDAMNEGPTRRAMYNGNTLIGVGACRITTAALDTPDEVISSLPIYGDACEFPSWY